jgi:hypothetical protein
MHGERNTERGEEEERITERERERGKWGLGWVFFLFISLFFFN